MGLIAMSERDLQVEDLSKVFALDSNLVEWKDVPASTGSLVPLVMRRPSSGNSERNMAAESHGIDLLPVIALLGAAVVAAPLFKRIGLGSVLGYLAAGLPSAPSAWLLQEAVIHSSRRRIGRGDVPLHHRLEMRPSRLWGLRREIFGLGIVQVALCANF